MRLRPNIYVAAILAFAVPAHADGPILHEYIAPDAAEDLRMGATTLDGAMPAAIDTRSGVLPAPTEPRTNSAASQVAYGGSATPDSIDASYRIDRDTSRPDSVRYDDPFIPTVTPFKRLYAYDGLDDGFELVVHDKSLAASRKRSGRGRPCACSSITFGLSRLRMTRLTLPREARCTRSWHFRRRACVGIALTPSS